VSESGVGALIRATYHLLGLRTYFTAARKSARVDHSQRRHRAKAAGVIHSTFEPASSRRDRGLDDLVKLGSRPPRARRAYTGMEERNTL